MKENAIREIRSEEIPLLKDFLYEAISLYKDYRHQGIGTELLREMLQLLRRDGYPQISLSVQKENYAFRMYQKAGFEVLKETGQEYLMVCKLKNHGQE